MNPFQFILILSLSLYKSIYELYLIKPFYLTENTIYVKLHPEAANTADSYYLKSGSIYSQWNYLSKSLYLLFFLSNFYFVHQMIALQELWKMFFISSECFSFHSFHLLVLEIFKFLWFFPFHSALSRFKRKNGNGIIYDAMNWLA